MIDLPDHWKVLNCAVCDRLLLSDSMRATVKAVDLPDSLAFIAGRVHQYIGGIFHTRALCRACVTLDEPHVIQEDGR